VCVGFGRALTIFASTSGQFGSLTRSFSYDDPNATVSVRDFGASTGQLMITIFGEDFGVSSRSVSLTVGFTSSHFSVWGSDSTVFSRAPQGVGRRLQLFVTVDSLRASTQNLYSFQVPLF